MLAEEGSVSMFMTASTAAKQAPIFILSSSASPPSATAVAGCSLRRSGVLSGSPDATEDCEHHESDEEDARRESSPMSIWYVVVDADGRYMPIRGGHYPWVKDCGQPQCSPDWARRSRRWSATSRAIPAVGLNASQGCRQDFEVRTEQPWRC